MKRIILPMLASTMLLGACATGDQGQKVADTKTAQEEVEAFDGHQRLPETVTPKHYRLSFDIDPAKERFSGEAYIRVELAEQTDRIDLHGEDLEFRRAWAKNGDDEVGARITEGNNGGITMSFEAPLDPGEVLLAFVYEAPLGQEPHGLYRVKDGEDWYAFTQFQPMSARRAFPSFDEPRFKTPFQISIGVPDGHDAFTNTAKESTINRGEADQASKSLSFEETRPLPTYLVALASGPLDVVEAPEEAIPGVPLRVITTRGKSELASYALERAPEILEVQTDYFGMPMPFSKLDMVAVPNFFAGAMENVGLVTFRERLLLVDPDDATPSDKYSLQSVMAHEFAHMWFGNYVTPEWWNDLWLNEAFASWMATRTIHTVAPELEPRIDAVQSSLRVMKSDAFADARAIRQPIRGGGDVMNAFDGITYSKGRAVLQMLEAWMGEEDFRRGVRDYLQENAYDSATTDELIAAWEEVDDEPIEEMLTTFLDQPGTPLIEADFSCGDGDVTVSLEQSRYLPAGSSAKSDLQWKVPVCFRLGGEEGESFEDCVLVDQEQVETTRAVDFCPQWMHPNADEVGYYHWKLPREQFAELVTTHRDRLSKPERVALLRHARALVEAHAMSFADYLELIEAMAAEDHRVIVGQVVGALYGIEEAAVDEENRAEFTAWASEVIGPHAERLGFAAAEDEPAEDGLLRPRVIRAAAKLAGDQELRERAEQVADDYLQAPESVPVAEAKLALRIAAYQGDEALWTRLRDAIDRAPTPAARVATIRALGSFEAPELAEQSLDLMLTDAIRSQDVWTLMGPTLNEPQTREVTWDWLRDNWAAMVDKVGEKGAASFPWVGSAFCTEQRRDEVEAFFGDEAHQVEGMERNLNQALESIQRCVRYRAYIVDDAREFLQQAAEAR